MRPELEAQIALAAARSTARQRQSNKDDLLGLASSSDELAREYEGKDAMMAKTHRGLAAAYRQLAAE